MENNEEKKIVPKYEWVIEEGVDNITPVKRKIAKTMETTETFNYYDTLAYVMKMEKAIEDKLAEVEGLRSMMEAYKAELELIDSILNITDTEKEWNLALHEKLKAEEAENKETVIESSDVEQNDSTN